MATFTATIASTLNVFGASPASQWGIMVWGVDDWGTDDDLVVKIFKVISETQNFSDATVKFAQHTLTDSFGFSDATAKKPVFSFSETLNMSSEASTLVLTDSNGYKFVYRDDTTNGSDQVNSSYSATADASTTYSATADGSTSWSDA